MQNGTAPRLRKRTDYSERTFGAPTLAFPTKDFNLDAGLTMPDQIALGMPYGCTGVTQADIAGDEDKAVYDPHFTYDKTRLAEGTYPQQTGCLIEHSIRSTQADGVKLQGGTDADAPNHARGKYFDVDRNGNDYFDAIRSVLWINKRPVSVGSIWYPVWENPLGPDAILPMPDTLNLSGPWHNYKISGWKIINGVPYLMVKSWQGPGYGDHGWVYLSREVCNAIFTVWGTQIFTYGKAGPGDIVTVRLSIMEELLSALIWLKMLLFAHPQPQPAPTPTPAPQTPTQPPQPAPEPPKPAPVVHSDAWCGGTLEERARMFHLAATTADNEGLSPQIKQDYLETIAGESGFNQWCKNTTTKDYGVAQFNINTYCKEYDMTPAQCLEHPETQLVIMARNFKPTPLHPIGRARNWIAYENRAEHAPMVAQLRAYYLTL